MEVSVQWFVFQEISLALLLRKVRNILRRKESVHGKIFETNYTSSQMQTNVLMVYYKFIFHNSIILATLASLNPIQ